MFTESSQADILCCWNENTRQRDRSLTTLHSREKEEEEEINQIFEQCAPFVISSSTSLLSFKRRVLSFSKDVFPSS